MIKTLEIEDRTIEVNSGQGWLFCYKEQFGHDIVPDLLPLLDATLKVLGDTFGEEITVNDALNEETIDKVIVSLSTMEATTIINILWAMAKNAGNKTPHYEFINEFDPFPYEEVAPMLFGLILKSSVASKNLASLQKRIPALSRLMTSLSQEQAED